MCEPECSVERDAWKPQVRRDSHPRPSPQGGTQYVRGGSGLPLQTSFSVLTVGKTARGVRVQMSGSLTEGEQGLATFRRCGSICRRRAWGGSGRAESPVEARAWSQVEPRPASVAHFPLAVFAAPAKGEKSEVSSDSWDRKRKGIEVSWKGNDEGDGQEGSRDTGRVGGSRLKSGGGPQ